MDGGGRLLRSLGEADAGFFPDARPRFVSPFALLSGTPKPASPGKRARLRSGPAATPGKPALPGLGGFLVLAVLAGTGVYGAYRGGEYGTFVAANGTPADIVSKALGFDIKAVTISGLKALTPSEVLQDGEIGPRNSLVMLDASALRDKLKSIALVQDVSVRKLFPNALQINVQERDAAAVWQRDGQLSLIAADGVPIDTVRDDRFNALPFVVGSGANARLSEFQGLLAAAGELRDRIKAGVLVGERRWTLQMDNGIEVELPEIDAVGTLKLLAGIERQSRILEKDVVSIDLRIPGRITARLTEDATAQRAAMLAKRPKAKANPA